MEDSIARRASGRSLATRADQNSPPRPRQPTRADALARVDLAWHARVNGATWQQAAEVSGYSSGNNCQRAVSRIYGRLPTPDRESLRALWRERLEALWRQAHADVLEQRPGAVTAAVRIQQAAASLDGLNSPAEVVLSSPTQHELEAWVASVMRHGGHSALTLEEADIFEG